MIPVYIKISNKNRTDRIGWVIRDAQRFAQNYEEEHNIPLEYRLDIRSFYNPYNNRRTRMKEFRIAPFTDAEYQNRVARHLQKKPFQKEGSILLLSPSHQDPNIDLLVQANNSPMKIIGIESYSQESQPYALRHIDNNHKSLEGNYHSLETALEQLYE